MVYNKQELAQRRKMLQRRYISSLITLVIGAIMTLCMLVYLNKDKPSGGTDVGQPPDTSTVQKAEAVDKVEEYAPEKELSKQSLENKELANIVNSARDKDAVMTYPALYDTDDEAYTAVMDKMGLRQSQVYAIAFAADLECEVPYCVLIAHSVESEFIRVREKIEKFCLTLFETRASERVTAVEFEGYLIIVFGKSTDTVSESIITALDERMLG